MQFHLLFEELKASLPQVPVKISPFALMARAQTPPPSGPFVCYQNSCEAESVLKKRKKTSGTMKLAIIYLRTNRIFVVRMMPS
jgi:hypothetical protein